MRFLFSAIALVLAFALIAWGIWTAQKDNEAWHARHGECLHWTVTQHVPLHRYRCDKWERP